MRVRPRIVMLSLIAGALPLLAAGSLAWILSSQTHLEGAAAALWALGLGAAVLALVAAIASAVGHTIDRRLEAEELRTEAELAAMTRLVEDPARPADPGGPAALAELLRPLAEALAAERDAAPGPALKNLVHFLRPSPHRARLVGVNAAVEVCTRAMTPPGDAGAGRLTFDPDPNVREASLDPDAFHQLLLHLILNARQAAGPSGCVEVRTQAMEDVVLVAVRDDGPGVPPDQIARIFEPFVTTRQRSAGLGLAICRQIAAAHGGTIAAANVLPHGLEVGVKLPARTRTAAQAQ